MGTGEILTELIKFGIGAGLLTFLAKSLWAQFLSRDIESYKAKLQAQHSREIEELKADIRTVAFEHETRFARLHDERVRVIVELYKKLARTDVAFRLWIAPLSSGNDPLAGEKAAAAANDLFEYFDENQIYFDPKFCADTVTLRLAFRRAWANFGSGGKPDPKDWLETWEEFERVVPPLRAEIEEQIRKILGVSSTPK
jgi:hypothetical protein